MTSGHSWHDVRTFRPAGQAWRAKITICSVLGFGCHQQRQLLWWVSSANKPPRRSPHHASLSPGTPLGGPAPPCPHRAAWERGTYLLGPHCQPASPGWGGSSATHKWERVVSGRAVPPRTLSMGNSGIWPQPGTGGRGTEQGRDLQEHSQGLPPHQTRDATGGGLRSGPRDGYLVSQTPARPLVPALAACPLSSTAKDCRGSSSARPDPAPPAAPPPLSSS